jgi:hypothetical protein
MLDEKNLFGAYPVINTKWYYDLSQNKAGIVEMPYTYVGFSASNFLVYANAMSWACDHNGTPVVDLP